MLIDFSEWELLAEKLGETKMQILQACITPKGWSELMDLTKKAQATLSVHVNTLEKEMGLLSYDKEKHSYTTTEKGVEFLELAPNRRPLPQNGKPYEIKKIVGRGIELGEFSLKEKVLYQTLGLVEVERNPKLNGVYVDVAKAIREAVTLWLPQGLEPDKTMYAEVNRLVGLHTKKNFDYKNGKITMIIEYDLPTALEKVIREENNDEIRKHLEKNREIILRRVHRNWYNIFNRII